MFALISIHFRCESLVFIFFSFIYSKVFLCSLVQSFWPSCFLPINFVCKSQVLLKVKSFTWLLAYKKVNIDDMLHLRRSYKAFNYIVRMLCMECGESVDHLFLYCPLPLGRWYRLFILATMDWVPPRSKVQNLDQDWYNSIELYPPWPCLVLGLITESKSVEKIKTEKMKNFGRKFQSLSLNLHLHPSNLSFCILV